jgi:tetratricopeptide (TPR) repeat protein/predicted aspartyl protease
MTTRACAVVLAAILSLWAPAGLARAAHCKMSKMAEIPLTIDGHQAYLTLNVNGTDETFILDSGSFYSSISSQKAVELKLPLMSPPPGLTITGIGGQMSYNIARVRDLTIYGVTIHNREFITGGTDFGTAGVLGQNFLRSIGDVEYDLANGVVRLWHTESCRGTNLAYWVTTNQGYSVINIDSTTLENPHTRGSAFVNGTRIQVMFGSGDWSSTLSLRAAERVGVKPGTPGVESGGYTYGVGRRRSETWIAPFTSFKIGDEEIRNTRLRIGDVGIDTDMLLGFDFFLSHRIFVASSQGKLYFTYNGGPVFNLTRQARLPAAPATAGTDADNPRSDAAETSAASAPSSVSTGQVDGAQPADAAGYRRRAAIRLVQHDYEHAISDLTRAIELNPADPQLFRDRASAYAGARQIQLARADLDHALTLKPDDVSALLARAQIKIDAREQSSAIADLRAASDAVPKGDSSRLQIGQLFQRAGEREAAIREYDLWLAAHDEDALQGDALFYRCHARMEMGQDLDKALGDCSASLRRLSGPASAAVLETRALVRLRRGELDRAIEDASTALKLEPRNALALYERGLARVRKGAVADGQADQAAARVLQPAIEDEFRKLGLAP